MLEWHQRSPRQLKCSWAVAACCTCFTKLSAKANVFTMRLQEVKQQLPPVQQYMLAQVAKLSSSNPADRRAAVSALGERPV
jgi:hypothetical protein